jgi:toxin ParE1/3/4
MKRTVVFRAAAQQEYDEAAQWYEERQAGLSLRFETEIAATLAKIVGHPDRYPVVRRDIREALVQRFPFCVYFRIRNEKIVVLSIFHTARDPDVWQSRG